jgi:hypothetical protein
LTGRPRSPTEKKYSDEEKYRNTNSPHGDVEAQSDSGLVLQRLCEPFAAEQYNIERQEY